MHVGKESNKLEERMREESLSEDDYLNVYGERLCGCGCGEPVSGRAKYVETAHGCGPIASARQARATDPPTRETGISKYRNLPYEGAETSE